MITELKESRENYITYKNFCAKVLPYAFGEGYRGQIIGIKDYISFHSQTKEGIEKAMQEAVDYYLGFNLDCEVEETIEKFIDEEKLFTAYDITRYLRKEFPKEDIPHYKVRKIVETLYQRDREESDYTRTLIDVGAEVQPWLYHHKDLPTDQVKKLYDAQSNKFNLPQEVDKILNLYIQQKKSFTYRDIYQALSKEQPGAQIDLETIRDIVSRNYTHKDKNQIADNLIGLTRVTCKFGGLK